MANSAAAFGLIPRKHASGSHYNAALNSYYVPATDGQALYMGDPVVMTGEGYGPSGAAVAARAGATGAITGVIVGFGTEFIGPGLGYRPASTAGHILVNDDPDTLYEVMDNANGGVAMDGSNANLAVGTGNAATRQSGFTLNSSSSSTTATLQVKVLRGEGRVDNDPTMANGKWLVKINNSNVASNTTGV